MQYFLGLVGAGLILVGMMQESTASNTQVLASASQWTTTDYIDESPVPTINATTTTMQKVELVLSNELEDFDFGWEKRKYKLHERGAHVIELQKLLGLTLVDGIYGRQTRKAHMNYLGGFEKAIYVLHPEFSYWRPRVSANGSTLEDFVNKYFKTPEDREWAFRVAFCESSAQKWHTGSKVVSSALAAGWFQHLSRFWSERCFCWIKIFGSATS